MLPDLYGEFLEDRGWDMCLIEYSFIWLDWVFLS